MTTEIKTKLIYSVWEVEGENEKYILASSGQDKSNEKTWFLFKNIDENNQINLENNFIKNLDKYKVIAAIPKYGTLLQNKTIEAAIQKYKKEN